MSYKQQFAFGLNDLHLADEARRIAREFADGKATVREVRIEHIGEESEFQMTRMTLLLARPLPPPLVSGEATTTAKD